MGSNNSKVSCLILPGQSGKTRNMQHIIRKYDELSRLDSDHGELNIVICSNNRALVKQTESRMINDLYTDGLEPAPRFMEDESDAMSDAMSDCTDENESTDAMIEGNVFSWCSGKKNRVSSAELCLKIIEGDVSMIVCCANKIRLQYVFDLVNRLNGRPYFTKKINFWLDEADSYINLWSKSNIDVTRLVQVNKVTLVSATFDSIFKKYGRIKVIPFEQTTCAEKYHSVQDCSIITDDSAAENAVDYFKTVYAKYKTDPNSSIQMPGVKLFAPGDIRKDTHDQIADYLTSEGFAVAILNGDRKAILYPDGRSISIEDKIEDDDEPIEIGRKIANIYRDSNLSIYPFAITGHNCLSRGITFQNESFMFDWGIIPNIKDAATAYQTACRMAGNVRELDIYKVSTLIMSTRMKDKVICREKIATNLARICFEENLADVGKEDLRKAGNDIEHSKMTVPIIIQTDAATIQRIHAESKVAIKRNEILLLLSNNGYAELVHEIHSNNYKAKQISRPGTDNAYKKNVTDVVKAVRDSRKYILNLSVSEKQDNSWQAVLDDRENRVIILVYKGK
jgi:hypothetical protein